MTDNVFKLVASKPKEEEAPEEVKQTTQEFLTEAVNDLDAEKVVSTEAIVILTNDEGDIQIRSSEGMTRETAYFLLGVAQSNALLG